MNQEDNNNETAVVRLSNDHRQERANTLCNAIQQFQEEMYVNAAPQTKVLTKQAMDLFEAFTGNIYMEGAVEKRWCKELAKIVQAFQDKLFQDGYMDSTVDQHKRRLNVFFNWCVKKELILLNPMVFVTKFMIKDKGKAPIFTHEEYELMKESSIGNVIHWEVILFYNTGLSLVDGCTLRWDSVDMERLIIRRARTKMARYGDKSICTIPILPRSDLHEALVTQLEERDESDTDWPGPGYVNRELARIYLGSGQSTVSCALINFLRRIGIQGKTMHTFRRTFISNLANSGMNTALACKMSGHSDPTIFAQYVQPDEEAMRSGMKSAMDWSKKKPKRLLLTKRNPSNL